MEEQKRCPYCDELIRVSAVKCRYCGSSLIDKSQHENISIDTGIHKALNSKYEILEELGKGGMAVVYKAIHRNLNRIVALKIIHKNLIHDDETVLRFRREAQLGASLLHPNIVMVFDEGRIEDTIYMSLEFLEGDDLHKLIKQKGRLSLKETLDIIIPLAEALDYVHRRNLVHRDIKSSNIFLTKSKRSVLTDFGIAYARESESNLTRAGEVIGTPEFMSPEQASGAKVDGRSDLFSLGIVIYQCLAGRVPFKGDTHLSTIFQITRDPLPNILNFNKDLPGWITPFLEKCLEKSPEKRIQTGGELAQMLRQQSIDGDLPKEEPSKQGSFQNNETDELVSPKTYAADDIEGIIEDAEKLFDNNKFKKARSLFEKALEIRPDDQYVKNKIEHLNRIFETITKAEEEKLLVQKKYDDAVLNGDDFLQKEKYQEAKDEFEKARSLKRFEKYPKKKLTEIDSILEKIKIEEELIAKEKAYDEKVVEAEVLLEDEKWKDAKDVLFAALEIKPDDTFLQTKIKEVDSEIKRIQKEKEEQEAKEKAFYKEIASAGDLLKSGDLEKAIASYEKANLLKPDEDYVTGKIREVAKKIEQKRLEEEERIAKEKAFHNELSTADNFYSLKDYQNALASYEKALEQKPGEEYVIVKITETKETIELLRLEEEDHIAKDKAYQEEVTIANGLCSSEDYENALISYKNALELKPDDEYVTSKIKETEDTIELLRLEEEERVANEKAYQEELAIADGLYSSDDYNDALDSYKKVLKLKPNETHVTSKIKEIEETIERLRIEEEERIAKEKAFHNELSIADNFYSSKDYDSALASYEKALEQKPDEEYVIVKIREAKETIELLRLEEGERIVQEKAYQDELAIADGLFSSDDFEKALVSYNKALELKPNEEYIKNKIVEIEDRIKQIQLDEEERIAKEKSYQDNLTSADDLYSSGEYRKALALYKIAQELNPEEKSVVSKIKEAEAKIKKIEQEDKERIAKEKSYLDKLTSADNFYSSGKYEKAIVSYREAQELKPDEEYVFNKIEEVEARIVQKQLEEEKRVARDKAFQNELATADNHYSSGDYDQALASYKNAQEINPDEESVVSKISETEARIEQIQKEEEERIAKEKSYRDNLSSADIFYSSGEFENALALYKVAEELKPGEKSVASKIKKTEEKIEAERLKEEKRIAQQVKDNKRIDEKYKILIKEGDKLHNKSQYEEAIEKYKLALEVKPEESYPKDRIAEINDIIITRNKAEEEKKIKKKIVTEKEEFLAEPIISNNVFYEDKTISLKINLDEAPSQAKDTVQTDYGIKQDSGSDKSEQLKPKEGKSKKLIYGLVAVVIILIGFGGFIILNSQSSTPEIQETYEEETAIQKVPISVQKPSRKTQYEQPGSNDNLKKEEPEKEEEPEIKIDEFESLVSLANENEKKGTLAGANNAIELYDRALKIKNDDGVSSTKNKLATKIRKYNRIVSMANDEYATIEKVDEEIKKQKQKASLELYVSSKKYFAPGEEIRKRIRMLENDIN